MSEVRDDRRYSKEHEWVVQEEGRVRLGITDFAQNELGDVIFVELPEVGKGFHAGEAIGTVESVKSVSDVYTPISGRVVEKNEALEQRPELVNQDPYGEGWLVKIEPTDWDQEANQLLDAAAYRALIGE
ncbi:MAG: glycine cleavage system protein GcvH [Firmicutes bacterium]|nr:glycine cleavage system protein GcvH [Bacillota bacterium]